MSILTPAEPTMVILGKRRFVDEHHDQHDKRQKYTSVEKNVEFAEAVSQHVERNLHQSLQQTFQTLILELNMMKAKMKSLEVELQHLKHDNELRNQRNQEKSSYIA